MCRECEGLRAQLAEAREELAAWRDYRAPGTEPPTVALQRLGLSPQRAAILWRLTESSGRVVPHGALYDALEATPRTRKPVTRESLNVQLHHLRKAGWPVRFVPDAGYAVTPETAARVRELVAA